MKKFIIIFLILSISLFAEERFNDKLKAIGKLEKPKEYIGKSKKRDVKEELRERYSKKNSKKEIKPKIKKAKKAKKVRTVKKAKEVKEKLVKKPEKTSLGFEEEANLTPNMKLFKSLIDKVKERRKGIDELKINILINPFSMSEEALKELEEKRMRAAKAAAIKTDTNASVQLNLLGIFDNKVNINGKWYKLNEVVFGNKIRKINRSSAVLEDKKGPKTLYLRGNYIKEKR